VSDRPGVTAQRPPAPPVEDGARPTPSLEPHKPRLAQRGLAVQAVAAAVVVIAVAGALLATNLRISARPAITTDDVNAIVNQKVSTAISELESQPPAASTAYQAVRAGIVVIRSGDPGAPGTDDLGSGVIVDTRGDILTALDVVQGASSIKVTFADGTTTTADLAAADPSSDIAVLAPRRLPAVLVPAVLGAAPQIGAEVFALGNPLGLVGSLSAGIVSGLGRTFKLAGGRTLSGLIQFDAAVNPGSDGGPLLNTQGQVIGIVTGLANPSGADNFAGIGFAVPIATAGQAAGAPAK